VDIPFDRNSHRIRTLDIHRNHNNLDYKTSSNKFNPFLSSLSFFILLRFFYI